MSHKLFAPSGSTIWLNCKVSLAMCRSLGLPYEGEDEDSPLTEDGAPNPFAAEGTLAHAVGEWCLNNGKNAVDCIEMDVNETLHKVEPVMHKNVQIYINHIRSLITKLTDCEYERYCDLSFIDPELGGTADYAGITGDLLDIGDLKYGMFHRVSAVRNTQLMLYALGMVGPDNKHGIKRIRLHIIQPRINPVPQVWELTIDELMEFKQRVVDAVAAHRVRFDAGTLPESLEEYSFGEHCKFCRAIGSCRKVDGEFMKESEMSVVQLARMGNDELAARLVRAKVLDKYIKVLEKDARARLDKGQEVPGFGLTTSLRREWLDEGAVVRIAAENSVDVMCVKSPADLGKDLGNDVLGTMFKGALGAKEVVKMVQM